MSEYVEGLVRRIQKNLGNTNPIGNGLPSTMDEVKMLAGHESNSCISEACRLVLQRKPKMMAEEEIRTHLKIAILIAQKDQAAGNDITYQLGIIAAMRMVLGLKEGEEVA